MNNFNFVEDQIYRDLLLYRINRAGMNAVELPFSIDRENRHPYHIIHYIYSGFGVVVYKGREYRPQPGTCFILPAYESHSYKIEGNNPWELIWIEFSGGDSHKLVKAITAREGIVIGSQNSACVKRYLYRIMTLLKMQPASYPYLVSKLIYNMLLGLLEREDKNLLQTASIRYQNIIDNVTVYISEHLNADLSINQLAQRVNISPFHFSRSFHRMTGHTPAKYIMLQRITKAKQLLYSENVKTDYIAETLGFCNTSHFISNFKKIEGCTPSEYRKSAMAYGNIQINK